MAYQAVEQKKDDFRKYLDKNGVVDALTNALIGLYEESEKPEDPLNYLLSAIQSASGKQAEELQAVKEENEKLKERIAELEEKVAQMSGSGPEQVDAQPQQEQPKSDNETSPAVAEPTPTESQ